MNALQQLIRLRMAERRWSYGDVARRGGLARSTVHHLATTNNAIHPPHPGTLEKLAAGLDLPLVTIRAAAASAAGFAVGGEELADPEIEVIVAGLNQLGTADRRHVAALIRSLLDTNGPADVPKESGEA